MPAWLGAILRGEVTSREHLPLPPCSLAPADTNLYALGVLDVPGMPEGRPALLQGDVGGCPFPAAALCFGRFPRMELAWACCHPATPGSLQACCSKHAAALRSSLCSSPPRPASRPAPTAAYLRTAHQPEREIAALVAATDGSTAFLLMPPEFWDASDVAPLVRGRCHTAVLRCDAAWMRCHAARLMQGSSGWELPC